MHARSCKVRSGGANAATAGGGRHYSYVSTCTGVVLLLIGTCASGGAAAAESLSSSSPRLLAFAQRRLHVPVRTSRSSPGPVGFADSFGLHANSRKPPRRRGWIQARTLREEGADSNHAVDASSTDNIDECDQSTRHARIVGPVSAAMAVLTTALPSFAIPTASEGATASSSLHVSAITAAVEGTYESSLAAFFPSSLPVSTLSEKVLAILRQRQFTSSNMELLTSLCSDENNEAPNTLVSEIRSKMGEGLGPTRRLGALAGLPVYAKSSLDLVLNRDNLTKRTKILIVYGPHVGIGSSDGIVGKKGSGACGSVLGAYTEILQQRELERLAAEGKISTPRPRNSDADDDVLSLVDTPGPRRDTLREVQQDYIVQELQKRLTAEDFANPDQNVAVGRVMEAIYKKIDDLLRTELDDAIKRNSLWDKGIDGSLEIVFLGGIVVRGEAKGSEDLFKPLAFDSIAMSYDRASKIERSNLLPMLLDTTTKSEGLLTGRENVQFAPKTSTKDLNTSAMETVAPPEGSVSTSGLSVSICSPILAYSTFHEFTFASLCTPLSL